jgi:hypothetical protein
MILFFVLFAIACDGGNTKLQTDKTGEEDFPCFANDTCNKELVCVDDVCVRLSNDTENLDTEESNDDFTDDIQELDTENSDIDETESNDDFIDDIQEDDSDAVELDNEEIPDEDDTPIPDIYNCFNDERYFYHNGDCWLKEENIIYFDYVYDETKVKTIYDFREVLREQCANVGGFLPRITDFRKNIIDEEFCKMQMPNDNCEDQCSIYDTQDYHKDDNCTLTKYNWDYQFLYPNITINIFFSDIIQKNTITKEMVIIIFTYIMIETEQKYITSQIYNYSYIKTSETYPLTCIKNLTEL